MLALAQLSAIRMPLPSHAAYTVDTKVIGQGTGPGLVLVSAKSEMKKCELKRQKDIIY